MKIVNVSCEQFAGVRDRSIALTDGINVIYGKNESGKSTLVNLISRVLFQDSTVGEKTTRDKEFRAAFFPAAKKGSSIKSRSADGKLTFETDNGRYTLTKVWGDDSRCVLITPDDVIRDSATISEILKEALVYGEGVYSDMLLSSQRNTDVALQTILDASSRTEAKQELADAMARAFAESDGVSTDVIEQAIQAKIDDLIGKHWDIERDAPVRKVGRWSTGLGEILKAYYIFEDAKAVLEKISQLEREADRTNSVYTERDVAVHQAEDAYNRFRVLVGKLAMQKEREKTISRIEAELSRITDILSKWPSLVEKLNAAKRLEAELSDRKSLDLYESTKALHDAVAELKKKASEMPVPDSGEISEVKAAQKRMAALENMLCGMNLTAIIKTLGDYLVEIKSLRTGEVIEISDETSITEAVVVTIPGVVEMQLAPANINVTEIEQQLAEQNEIIQNILKKYSVTSLDELETLSGNYSVIQSEIAEKTSKLTTVLGGVSFDDVEKTANAIVVVPRSKDEISAEILVLCGGSDLSRYVVSNETTIKAYEDEYISVAELTAKASVLTEELQKAKESVADTKDIPAEFLNIADPEGHLDGLQRDLKFKQQLREDALREKTTAATNLENYEKNISGDPEADVEKAERDFNEQKELLVHWQHIAEVFAQQKENIADNPLVDLATHFTRYLGIISGGKVASEFPEADKLNMNIYSSDRLVDYGKLSEGTKETVSLAFRLAVLDHLFPDGGGIAVLDDPFANMDAERTAQSVELIKDFATRHQVIFLTCKEEYLALLQGNEVRL